MKINRHYMNCFISTNKLYTWLYKYISPGLQIQAIKEHLLNSECGSEYFLL